MVAHLVVAFRAPEEANTPKDERERLIDFKATRVAYRVSVAGAMMAISTLHLGANAIGISYAVLLALVLGAVVNYAARIVFHRRGI